MSDPWMQTVTGRAQRLTGEQISVDLFDVAVALSRIPRFNAQTIFPVWVAQHSVLVSRLVPPDAAAHALLHDAHEAFAGDIPTPVKWAIGPEGAAAFKTLTDRLDCAIWLSAGLPPPNERIQAEIRLADLIALMTERRDAMGAPPRPWRNEDIQPSDYHVHPCTTADAFKLFVDRLCELLPDAGKSVVAKAQSFGLLAPRILL